MTLPEQFIARMKQLKDFDFDAFMASYNTPALSGARINPLKDPDGKKFESAFEGVDRVDWCDTGYYIHKDKIKGTHPYHQSGLFYFQEPSAMCAAEMFPLDEGDIVLDLCAAPGGKSTQIAPKSNITLVSNEIISKRSFVLSENIERMGFSNVIVTNESPERLSAKYVDFFDKIIIDAPCSGEGMFKKEPAAVESWSVEHVLSCAVRQQRIIDSAMLMLRQGGSIVYSTCTFSKEENDDNVKYIVDKYPYMHVENVLKLYPHIHKGEGHFAALLKDTREKGARGQCVSDKYVFPQSAVSLYRQFEKEYLNIELDGEFLLFGENLYLKPKGVCVDGIKTVRPGLHLGVCKKDRFEPAHALSKALDIKCFKNVLSYDLFDISIMKYLKGETLNSDIKGYCVIACDGLPMGWGKGSGGVVKNKLPKGLRIF